MHPHRNDNLVLISTLLVLGVAALAGLAGLLLVQIVGGAHAITANRQELAQQAVRQQQLLAFRGQQPAYQPAVDAIAGGFVDLQNPVDAIRFLESAAASRNLGITISIAQPDQSGAAGDSAKSLGMSVSVRGAFLDALAFAEEVENGPYFMNVQKLSVAKFVPASANGGQPPPSGGVQATLLMQAMAK